MSNLKVDPLKDHNSSKFRFSKLVRILCALIWACLVLVTISVILSLDMSTASAASNQTVITVINNNNSGAGSLRQAILDASNGDAIVFAPNVSGTIGLTTDELAITKSLTIQGPSPTLLAVSGSNATRVFYIFGASGMISVSISGLTIRDGNTSACGGGICVSNASLTLSDTMVVSNTGGLGGGIANYATTTIINSSILSNVSQDTGGGINNVGDLVVINSTISGNQTLFAPGGGINTCCASANTIIWNSTIANNRSAYYAGGIGIGSGARVMITNTTISGNTSETSGGGGLDVYGTARIFNSTVVSNSAISGGGIRNSSGSVIIKNSIVADNTIGGDCAGNVQSGGHNLSTSAACSFIIAGDMQNIAPHLGPLANNGGQTPTHMLLPGSPAINAGDNTGCPIEDQRGIQRPQAGICDIGAVELEFPNTLYLPSVLR